ncbi:hypothetical protein GS462_24390 [Rhodococcus hoagii]|nr:hypothetical protein [Prescottella equi]
MTNTYLSNWERPPARGKEMQRENAEWAAKCGPVMVRKIGEPREAARPISGGLGPA